MDGEQQEGFKEVIRTDKIIYFKKSFSLWSSIY